MAHGDNVRQAVRASFVFDCLDMPAAAAKHNVPEATARRWKYAAKEMGDDWDKARGAQMLAGGGIEEVSRQTLALVVLQVQATLQTINETADMPPAVKVQMLASLSDSYLKLSKVATKLMPETTQLATAMDVLQRLVKFIRDKYPQHAGSLAEVLHPFGEEVSKAYG
ncbi:DUF1804 family protein [Chitinimonas viridis]|uniref:DUF1804 family protein n=1 Tax=Chitinimonas viridis TaxID=664880 RepID=A0ABT8B9J3_9NEIS|nr:DUF1804 family protein [Chitinimonas viridis]MDN3578700.1 DUF1804 family protein [Chitinimonas viridis]